MAWLQPQLPKAVVAEDAGSSHTTLPDPAVIVTISTSGDESDPEHEVSPSPMEVDFAASSPTTEEPERTQQAPVQRRHRDRHRQVTPAGADEGTPDTPTLTTSTTSSGVWLLRFDGACRDNPGLGGAGAILYSPTGEVLWKCAHYIHGNTTNNIAEYTGLLAGVEDHNDIAAALTDNAKRKRKALYAVWYDLQNTFGSVPHAMIWFVLEKLGVASSFISRCKDHYSDAAFIISNAKDGSTAPIGQHIGVFQGCPLSLHLFTAVLIPLLLALQGLPEVGVQLSKDDTPSVTAYADDLKVFSSSRVGTKNQHNLMQRFLKWSGMRANPAKCSSLGVVPAVNTVLKPDNIKLHINGEEIPSISMSQSDEYLGIGDGINHEQRRMEVVPLLTMVKRQAPALFTSGLAPWQVLKAYKVYLLPRLEYSMRFQRPLSSQFDGLDKHIQRGFRHLLRLPADANYEFLYSPTSCGGLGLLPLAEMHAAIRVAYGWKLLHSQDAQVQRVARAQLGLVVRKRHNIDEPYWKGKEDMMLQLFLNNKLAESPYARKKPHHSDISSLWSDIQEHVHTYALSFETAPETTTDTVTSGPQAVPQGALHLRVPHFKDWLGRKTVLRHLKLHLKLKHRTTGKP
ncbi:reverse transcriptase [Phytophthora cinnamomi]|uniref:reverse transcriptase n=1 Tax=Phytophthora cinnamomi TaxID=4785 RepID=UPI00355A73A5|nr:reverse transcriptase [Phytophthora cinnamomi]